MTKKAAVKDLRPDVVTTTIVSSELHGDIDAYGKFQFVRTGEDIITFEHKDGDVIVYMFDYKKLEWVQKSMTFYGRWWDDKNSQTPYHAH